MMSSYLYQIIVCIIFLILLLIISRVLVRKKIMFTGMAKNSLIQIIEKRNIDRHTQLLVVNVNDELLLLGATEHAINLIKILSNKQNNAI